ncbi:hypothetical protein PIB30_086426 [Stylosanthes scabra]|uniref:Uncharacterized protein n=1 Tax=Stylosanthes scabra TaxID=79078 RepID=A0ABU6UU90_9FABA|nr:hypothetical protein [Stylosanthes scabra]
MCPRPSQASERRTQNTKNKSLFCDYHQGYGYKTQGCYDLKDAIEQAIWDGKLNEFVKIIREPRNPDRERSPRLESRNPRNRRDDDDPIMEVAVITGSSAVEKSKAALKKYLKVFAIVRTPPPQFPTITFSKEDFVHSLADSDSPMVILAKLVPRKTIMAEFVVLQDSTAYDVILGRETINDFSTAVLTKFLVMKYEVNSREVETFFGDRETAKRCCNSNPALRKRSQDATGIFLADIDAQVEEQSRPKPDGDL